MSNIVKLKEEVINYIIKRKLKNCDLSCRALSFEASHHFNIFISKSSVNSVLNKNGLSSPVGRKVSLVFAPSQEAPGVGHAFLLGADIMIGLSKILAEGLMLAHPKGLLARGSIEALGLAWIMSRAFYNVALDRISNYSKIEIWPLIGKRVSRGLLGRYFDMFKSSQHITNHIVKELSRVFQDVQCCKVCLADGSFFFLDGQGQSIWPDKKIPVNFSTTINIARDCINSAFFENGPMMVFSASTEGGLGESFLDFVICMEGGSLKKKLLKIDFLDLKGTVIKEVTDITAKKYGFIVGIWPGQHKAVDEIAAQPSSGTYFIDELGLKYPFAEGLVRFMYHNENKEVVLRIIVVKDPENRMAKIGLLTNIEAVVMKTEEAVGAYVRRFPFFDDGHRFFLNTVKDPPYLDDFITSEKILAKAKVLQEARTPDEIFSFLVDVLDLFSKRSFFPGPCSGWSFLKMRELFYKRRGLIRRDLADNVLFNILKDNELHEKNVWDYAILRFNNCHIIDSSGKQLWITHS